MDESRLTPRAAVREAVERVRVAYDDLRQTVGIAHATAGDEPHPDVMRHYLAEVGKRAAALGTAIADLELLVQRPTARRMEPNADADS
jgi:hypothetical protein